MILLGGAATWPPVTQAQQRAMPVIGFLSSRSAEESSPFVAAFNQGLSETGYMDHRNVVIEYRWAEGRYDRLPALAADLVRDKVDLIATVGGDASALAAKNATATFSSAAGPSKTASSPVSLGQAAISQVSSCSARSWAQNGSNYCPS